MAVSPTTYCGIIVLRDGTVCFYPLYRRINRRCWAWDILDESFGWYVTLLYNRIRTAHKYGRLIYVIGNS